MALNSKSVPLHMLKRFAVALLLVVALQPVYLCALVAVQYVAPPAERARNLTSIGPETPGDWDTECTSLSIGLEPSASPLRNAIFAARAAVRTNDLKTVCDALHVAAVAGTDDRIFWLPYPRYWHGYRVVLDPLTAFLSADHARLVMLAALIATIAWFATNLRVLVGKEATLALILPSIVFTDIWRMWMIMSHCLATITIFAGAALMARACRRDTNLILLGAALGSLFNFVDFLTNPPWQPMLLAFVVLAAGRTLFDVLSILAAWTLGYGLTWASKWGIAVASGVSWSDILEVIRFRLNGDYEQVVSHKLLAPSRKIVWFFFGAMSQDASRMTFAILTPALFLSGDRTRWREFLGLSWTALIPFAWFEILSNHTQIHVWNAYRPVATSIGIVLAAWVLATKPISPGLRRPAVP